MSMVKPIINSINAFDATKPYKVTFISNGGDQVIKNKLVVRNNNTNVVVYEDTVESYNLEHLIPSNTLTNGTNYNCSIYTYNINNESSAESDRVSFYCYSTPTIEFNNLTKYQTINKSYYNFSITYSQDEDEKASEAIFILFNNYGEEISRSDSIYFGNQNTVSYVISGFSDKENYSIQAICQTVHGFNIFTDMISFSVSYNSSQVFNMVNIENDCNNGYVKLKSNIVQINGKTNGGFFSYEDDYPYSSQTCAFVPEETVITWDEGFKLNGNTFNLGIWFNPVNFGKICELTNSDKTLTYTLYLRKYNGKVYLSLIGIDNKGEMFCQLASNAVQMTTVTFVFDNRSYCVALISYNSTTNTPEVKFATRDDIYEKGASHIYWNGNSEVYYNMISSMVVNYETRGRDEYAFGFDDSTSNTAITSSVFKFPITQISICNGLFDCVNLEKAISYDTSSDARETWNSNTLLCCDFDENIDGGNLSNTVANVDTLTVKRRKKSSFDWISLYQKTVSSAYDFNFIYYDYLCPSNETFEWAIVPSKGGLEGEYNIVTEESMFNNCYIYDITSMYKIYGKVNYGDTSANKNIQIFETLSNKYPIVINNSEINYRKGSMSFSLLDNNYMNTRRLNRKDNVDLSNKVLNFLTNGLSKIIKDWNGNITLIQVIGTPTLSYNNSIGMGVINVSFDWVEQGKYDNQNDLIKNNLLTVDDEYYLNVYVEEESAIVVPKENPIAYVQDGKAVFKNASYKQ